MKSLYVSSNYLVNDSIHGEVLSADQCQQIISSALEVLERTGVEVLNEKARKVFSTNGCWVDGTRVRFPSGLVEGAIRTTPSRVVLADREGGRKLFLEGSNSYYGPCTGNLFYVDPMTEERRKVLKCDQAMAAKLCDALPNIDFATDFGIPSDVAPPMAAVHSFEALLLNTTKPIVHWGYDVSQYNTILDICIAVVGSLERLQQKPFIALCSESGKSPGIHSEEGIGKVIWAAEKGLPQIYTPFVASKTSSPATMAGVLVQALSESFAGLVTAQLVRKGAPFVLGGIQAIMDRKSGVLSCGSAEFQLLQAAMGKLGRYLRIPILGTAGCTDSKTMDPQLAIEASLSLVTAGLMGINLVCGVGATENGTTGSLYQLALCDEVISYTKRVMRGIEVNDDTLAVGVIHQVGPGGHFLGEEHTIEYFKKEFWFPTLMDRTRYDEWKSNGALTMGSRVKTKVQRLLKDHQPKALSPEIVKKISQIVTNAEAKVSKQAKK
jgi:trimethylamine--corrinoid protein Co-methyltransferase